MLNWMIEHDVKHDKLYLVVMDSESDDIEKYEVSTSELVSLYQKIGIFIEGL